MAGAGKCGFGSFSLHNDETFPKREMMTLLGRERWMLDRKNKQQEISTVFSLLSTYSK
jgi:hypothetical protein